MDFNVSINARRGIQAGGQRVSSYDFAALAQWQRSATGSVEAAQRVRTWVEKGDCSATLDLGQFDLRSCPPLPPEVQILSLAFNPQLDTLPHPLPPGLTDLNINFCNFTRLPHDWPVGLLKLWLVTNKVTDLPHTLPAGLQTLCATNNLLTSVPGHLPDALQELYLATNQIAELDPGLLSLPNCTKLFLCNNPLSETSLAMLNERTGAPGYAGPAVKTGFASERIDLSEWLPVGRTAEMQTSNATPIVRRAAGDLTSLVNAMSRANPNQAVASYSDQYRSVVQAFDFRPARGNEDLRPSHT